MLLIQAAQKKIILSFFFLLFYSALCFVACTNLTCSSLNLLIYSLLSKIITNFIYLKDGEAKIQAEREGEREKMPYQLVHFLSYNG